MGLFKRNADGKIVEIETFFSLYPAQENGLRMLFGGEVLKLMDEISGSLATLYISTKGLVAVHAGQLVLFDKPISTGEAGKVVARVVRVTEKIVCVYIEVFGGSMQEPDNFTKRYKGFGLCAVINQESKEMQRNLKLYSDKIILIGNKLVSDIALEVIGSQRSIRRQLQAD